MEKVSVVIPAFRLSHYRLRNFEFVLSRVLDAPFHEVIVCEQVDPACGDCLGLRDSRVRHIKVPIEGDVICKSALVNRGVLEATGDLVWVNDADIFVPFAKALGVLSSEDVAVRPFRDFVDFSVSQTRDFIRTRHAKPGRGAKRTSMFGAGAFVVRRSFFLELGGFDESFSGWGYEDAEFGNRVPKDKIRVLDELRGVHLYHDVDDGEKARSKARNFERYVEAWRRQHGKDDVPTVDDTAVIVSVFGMTEGRAGAVSTAFKHLLCQLPRMKVVFVEAVEGDEPPLFQSLAVGENVSYKLIRVDDSYTNLFQKEAMWNVGAAECPECDKLIFLDSDVFATDPFWLAQIRHRLIECPQVVVQVYSRLKDTEDSSRNTVSLIASRDIHSDSEREPPPGHGWAMSRAVFESIGEWNIWAVVCSGDVAFIYEAIKDHGYTDYLKRYSWFRGILRDVPKFEADYVDVPIVHVGHPVNTCFYAFGPRLVEVLGDPRNYIRQAPNGLLQWKNPVGSERCAIRACADIRTEEAYSRLCAEVVAPPKYIVDTSVVVGVDARDEEQVSEAYAAIGELLDQMPRMRLVLVELTGKGVKTAFPAFAGEDNALHVRVDASEENDGLYQGHALWNIGADHCWESEHLIFVSPGVGSSAPDWLAAIRHRLQARPDVLVQGFRRLQTADGVTLRPVGGAEPIAPGVCWAMAASHFREVGGFNALAGMCGGDSAVPREWASVEYNDHVCESPAFASLLRDVKALPMGTVAFDVTGPVQSEEGHHSRWLAVERLGDPRGYIDVGSNGLLRWKDVSGPERAVWKRVRGALTANDVFVAFEQEGGQRRWSVPHVFERIHGHFSFEDFYRRMVAEAPDEAHFVEVGTFFGRSLAFLVVEALNSGKRIEIDAVDIWGRVLPDAPREVTRLTDRHGGVLYGAFLEHMLRFGLLRFVDVRRMRSVDAAATYEDGSLDFVFIDAGHRYPDVQADLQSYFPKVKPGGWFAGHDYGSTHEDVKPAVDDFFGDDYEVAVYNTTWAVQKCRE